MSLLGTIGSLYTEIHVLIKWWGESMWVTFFKGMGD